MKKKDQYNAALSQWLQKRLAKDLPCDRFQRDKLKQLLQKLKK